MRNQSGRQIVHALLFVTGLMLLIGGIISGKNGATVAGLIIAAVNVQQWVHLNKKEDEKS